MKTCKLLFFGVIAVLSFSLSSCLKGDNSSTISNAWGYVTTSSSGVTSVNTTGGYPIVSSTITSNLSAGQCVQISYTTDFTLSNSAYLATDVSFTKIPNQYSLTPETAISVDDSTFVTALTIPCYSYTNWFGDNYFLYITKKSYDGITATPNFYYSTDIPTDFDTSKDSVIIDVRFKVSGKATTTTASSSTSVCTVNLTPIRQLYTSYSGKYIPIYFKYYTSKTTQVATSKSAMAISE
ncbi:MAG: hypothetical protein QM654_05260 [Dysgonamonadaceae bacterium]